MLFKNSFKIMFSNFHLTWKSLIYHLFVFSLTCLLMYLAFNPIYSTLVDVGFARSVADVYNNFIESLNLAELFESLNYLISNLYHVVIDNMETLWKYFVLLGVSVFFVSPYLTNLVSLPTCNSLHYYMGSMTKQGFFQSYSELFRKNLVVQFVYYIFSILSNLFIMAVFVFSLRWITKFLTWSVFLVILLLAIVILLITLKNMMFVAWLPTITVTNYGIFKSWKVSLKNVFRKFGRVFKNMFGFVLFVIFINVSAGVFTLTIGLSITIPASYIFYNAFGMTTVYECQGMRYYIDAWNVITPRKKEVSDRFSEMKYIV